MNCEPDWDAKRNRKICAIVSLVAIALFTLALCLVPGMEDPLLATWTKRIAIAGICVGGAGLVFTVVSFFLDNRFMR